MVQYWINELIEEFPDLPLGVLKIEYENAIGTASNEHIWAMGSNNEDDARMHYENMDMNSRYAMWIKETAMQKYGEVLSC